MDYANLNEYDRAFAWDNAMALWPIACGARCSCSPDTFKHGPSGKFLNHMVKAVGCTANSIDVTRISCPKRQIEQDNEERVDRYR